MDQASCQNSLRFLIKNQPEPHYLISTTGFCLDRKDGDIMYYIQFSRV